MARPITILASILLFALCGLLIGWLDIQTQFNAGGSLVVTRDDRVLNYLVGPFVGAVIGLVLSIVILNRFAPRNP
jgi:hypothetical protein